MGDLLFWAGVIVVAGVYVAKWIEANECVRYYERSTDDDLYAPTLGVLVAYFIVFFGVLFTVGLGVVCAKWLVTGEFRGRGDAFATAFGWGMGAAVPALIVSTLTSGWLGRYYKYTQPVAALIVRVSRPRQYMQLMLPGLIVWAVAWGVIIKFELPDRVFAWVVVVTVAAVLAGSYLIPDFTALIKKMLGKQQAKKVAAAGANQQQQGVFNLFLGQSTGELAKRGHNKGMQGGLQVRLSQTDAATNMVVFGGIGAGKTTRVINPVMLQLMQQDCGGLIFDIKSDFKREVNYFAGLAGRKITTIGVGQRGINLLKGLSPEKAGTFLKSAFILESGSVGQNSYWIDNAVNMCIGALGVLEQLPGKYSLYNLYEYIFLPEERQFMTAKVQTIAATLKNTDAIGAEKLNAYINRYDTHFAKLDEKTKGLIESTVSTVLVGFTNPDIKKGFCEDNANCVEMKETLEGAIYLVDLPLPLFGNTAKVIYMWTKLLWFNVMQQRRVQKTWNQDRPVFFLCDEYQEIIAASKTGDSDLNFWDKSRSSGAIGIISMQHISSLYSAIGNKDVANTIMANFRQKICFRTEDETTLQYFNKMLGKAELRRVTTSTGSSNNNSGGGTSSNRSEQYYHQDILDAQTMRGMDSNYAVAMLNINNVACDDVIALQPAFVPQDYIIPAAEEKNERAEVYRQLLIEQNVRAVAFDDAYAEMLELEKAYGRDHEYYRDAVAVVETKRAALEEEIEYQLNERNKG